MHLVPMVVFMIEVIFPKLVNNEKRLVWILKFTIVSEQTNYHASGQVSSWAVSLYLEVMCKMLYDTLV